MKDTPDNPGALDLPDDPDERTDAMVEQMGLRTGDRVTSEANPHEIDVIEVDSIRYGEVRYHFPYVEHPQSATYGGPGAFRQPVVEWYKDWVDGNLYPVAMEVRVA